MLICRNAEGIYVQIKVGKSYFIRIFSNAVFVYDMAQNFTELLPNSYLSFSVRPQFYMMRKNLPRHPLCSCSGEPKASLARHLLRKKLQINQTAFAAFYSETNREHYKCRKASG